MITGVNHITLSVSDLTRSFNFYVDILGMRPIAKWNHGAYLSAGDLWLCLTLDSRTRSSPLSEYSHIAFNVEPDSFQTLVARLQKESIRCWQQNTSEGDSFYFLDLDGHKLEIHVGTLASRIAAIKKQPYTGLMLYV
jgi:catechol 2,3-dioxygenase-like lactoylglutathione lyase family enzyme